MNLDTPDGANPLKYIEETESGGIPFLSPNGMAEEVDASAVGTYIARIQNNCTGIELLLSQLLQRHSNVLSALASQQSTPPMAPSPGGSYPGEGRFLSLEGCSCQILLALALAARGAYQKSCCVAADMVAKDLHDRAFRRAFARIGELLFSPDDDSIVFLILGAHLLMLEAYPTGALKLIQAAGDRLGRCGRRWV